MDQLVRELVPQVLGILVRRGADFAAAEDAVQEALLKAWETWPATRPDDPRAWLVTTAWRKYLDSVDRAHEAAAYLSSAPGKGGEPIQEWIEVRPFLAHPATVTE